MFYCARILLTLYILRRYPLEELDILLRMKPGHVVCGGHVRPKNLHLFVQVVVEDEAVGDAQSVRLHRVPGAVVEVAHFGIVEVGHAVLALGPGRHHQGRTETDNSRTILFSSHTKILSSWICVLWLLLTSWTSEAKDEALRPPRLRDDLIE
jgi:hypothetical protein